MHILKVNVYIFLENTEKNARMHAQWCLTLCNSMDCSLPGSSVHRIFQARILEWVVNSSSKGSSWPRGQTHISCISCIGWKFLYHWATWEAPEGKKRQSIIKVQYVSEKQNIINSVETINKEDLLFSHSCFKSKFKILR